MPAPLAAATVAELGGSPALGAVLSATGCELDVENLSGMRCTVLFWLLFGSLGLGGVASTAGCDTTFPSARIQADLSLPVPQSTHSVPDPERFHREGDREELPVSAQTLIPIAFHSLPDIKSSFHRYKSEEAHYDFFYTSRDSLTPRLRLSNRYGEDRDPVDVIRTRDHGVEVGVEKLFFDTTELDVAVGLDAEAIDEAHGNQPFMVAALRYPLWVSRQKLERTSEEIFRRNELNDAQLAYIQTVRERLEGMMFRFYEVVDQQRQLGFLERWLADLQSLLAGLDAWVVPTAESDRQRLTAEIARVTAEIRNLAGRHEIDVERLKAESGIAFHVRVELVDEMFNPFVGMGHRELFQLSIQTDPEILTLRNAEQNARAQLDLARRGRWDLSLLLAGESNLDGGGERDGDSDWAVSVGFDVNAVDPRVTDSLIRQSESNITRFTQAIAERENQIFVDTLEPLIRIDTLGRSRDELAANLPRYQADYDTGIDAYRTGQLNIDDLLKRRETLLTQQKEISNLSFLVGANVAELCSATGKFFELLNGEPVPVPGDAPVPGPVPAPNGDG